jgi:hypothetical protein
MMAEAISVLAAAFVFALTVGIVTATFAQGDNDRLPVPSTRSPLR